MIHPKQTKQTTPDNPTGWVPDPIWEVLRLRMSSFEKYSQFEKLSCLFVLEDTGISCGILANHCKSSAIVIITCVICMRKRVICLSSSSFLQRPRTDCAGKSFRMHMWHVMTFIRDFTVFDFRHTFNIGFLFVAISCQPLSKCPQETVRGF